METLSYVPTPDWLCAVWEFEKQMFNMDTNVQVSNSAQIAQNQLLAVVHLHNIVYKTIGNMTRMVN